MRQSCLSRSRVALHPELSTHLPGWKSEFQSIRQRLQGPVLTPSQPSQQPTPGAANSIDQDTILLITQQVTRSVLEALRPDDSRAAHRIPTHGTHTQGHTGSYTTNRSRTQPSRASHTVNSRQPPITAGSINHRRFPSNSVNYVGDRRLSGNLDPDHEHRRPMHPAERRILQRHARHRPDRLSQTPSRQLRPRTAYAEIAASGGNSRPRHPVLVVGDSNFTRSPFNQRPFYSIARPGLKVAQAASLVRQSPIESPLSAVLVGVGVNDRNASSIEEIRTGFRRLNDALKDTYPTVPLFFVDTPAEKFGRDHIIKNRLHTINTVGACFFEPIHYKPSQIDTQNPHYSSHERRDLVRAVDQVMRESVRNLPRLC